MSVEGTLVKVAVDLVEEPDLRLRPVDETDERFKGLVESMRRFGFWQDSPIQCTGPVEGPYVIASKGMHRFVAAKRAGLKEVWIFLLAQALSDAELVERQIIDEATHVEARPAEFGRHLRVLQDKYRGITLEDLAKKVSRNAAFVAKALKLGELDEHLMQLVDDGEVKVGNGLALASLQVALRKIDPKYAVPEEVVRKARLESVEAFTAEVAHLIEEARKGPRARKEPAPKLRRVEDVRRELQRAERDPSSTPGYVQALAWVLRQDPVSAGAEGLQPVLGGAPEEGAVLRAECAKQRGLLEEYEVARKGLEARCAGLERELERMARIVEEKELVVKALEKGRRPEGAVQ